MTAAIIVMILVTVVFANNYLNSRMAENEFSAMKQFMQTAALQIDDVAWTIGRTQTIRYASQFGQLSFQSVALNYAVYVNQTNTWIANFSTVGVLMFNMPTFRYNIANNYVENIFPSSRSSFLLQGTTAPVASVFVIERVPMNDGNYIRVVVAPSIRMLNSTISTGTTTTSYYNCYLPVLQPGNNLYRSQSVTILSTSVNVTTVQNINKIKISLDFPKSGLGFNSSFFNFNSTSVEVAVPTGSVLEFYTGIVFVSLGLYS